MFCADKYIDAVNKCKKSMIDSASTAESEVEKERRRERCRVARVESSSDDELARKKSQSGRKNNTQIVGSFTLPAVPKSLLLSAYEGMTLFVVARLSVF